MHQERCRLSYVRNPLAPSRDFASVGGRKGLSGEVGIPPRSHNGPQITWLIVQGAMLCPTEPKPLPQPWCIQLCEGAH